MPPSNPAKLPTDAHARAAVLVFARAAELGKTKTRLARFLGDADTLRLYRAFLADTLRSARESGAQVILAHTPAAAVPEVSRVDQGFAQHGTGFGERLDHALARAREFSPLGPLVLIGADTPHLPPSALRQAFDALAEVPAVIGPSRGGGFHLLGFAGSPPRLGDLFDEPNEAAAVARRLGRTGQAPRLLPPLFDVDVEADLVDLLAHLELARHCQDAWVPGATAAALSELNLQVSAGEGGSNRDLVIARGR